MLVKFSRKFVFSENSENIGIKGIVKNVLDKVSGNEAAPNHCEIWLGVG